MRPTKIEMVGWMPFRHPVGIELPAGPIALVGEQDGDPERSNWSGKCLPGYVNVYDPVRGAVPISVAVEQKIPAVLGLDPDWKLVPRTVVDWMALGKRPAVRVKLNDGTSFDAAATHPIMTPVGETLAGELRPGDHVGAARCLPIDGVNIISVSEARLVGLLLGDGTVTKGVSLSCWDDDVVCRYGQLVGHIFNGQVIRDHGGRQWRAVGGLGKRERRALVSRMVGTLKAFGVGLERYSRSTDRDLSSGERGLCFETLEQIERDHSLDLWPYICLLHPGEAQRAWLRDMGIFGLTSYHKALPESRAWLPAEQTIELLAGLWDTDGYVGVMHGAKVEVSYSTCSERLAGQVRQWLLRLGIGSAVGDAIKCDQNGTPVRAFTVRLFSGEHVDRFAELVGQRLSCARKRRRLLDSVGARSRDQAHHDAVPNHFCKDLPTKSESGAYRTRGQLACVRMSRGTFLDFGGENRVGTGDVRWPIVESVEHIGELEMFDLELDEEPRFYVADTILVHNSAFLEAFEWCWFGRHRELLDDNIVNMHCDCAVVTTTFSDGTVVKRTRRRGGGGDTGVVVTRNGTTTSKKEAEAEIEKALGLSEDDIVATLLVKQGEVDAIVQRTSGDRRAIVASWLRLAGWQAAATMAKVDMKKRRALLDAARVLLQRELSSCMTAEQVAELEKGAAEKDAEAEQAQRSAHQWATELARAEQAEEGRIRHNNRTVLVERARRYREVAKTRGDAQAAYDEAAGNVARLHAAYISAQDEEGRARTNKETGFDGTCPVTCESCPVADEVQANVSAVHAVWREADSVARASRREWERAVLEMKRLESTLNETIHAAAQFTGASESIKAMGDVPAPDENAPNANDVRDRIEHYRIVERNQTVAAAGMRATLATAAKARVAADRASLEVTRLEREVRVSQLAVRCLGAVPNRIASIRLTTLETMTNALLSEHGLSIRFAWDRETKKLATRCEGCGDPFIGQARHPCGTCGMERGPGRKEELDILVTDGGPEVDASSKSGGCKALVGSAIRLAAGAMLRRERGSPAAFALVDEPFGSLDRKNRDGLARRLAWLLGASGLEQAIVVAHDADILDALPHRIVVRRSGGESTAELLW